jgi:pimeloyl-ACP methyl ester carboxylesterase
MPSNCHDHTPLSCRRRCLPGAAGDPSRRRARKNIPQARFATLASADHRLTRDSPAEFARLIGAFLREEGVLAPATG